MSSDETTPLLQGSQPAKAKAKTPLPKKQIAVVSLILFAEPISAQHIFPFINQWIRELGVTGGDDRKIGYYAGLIESLFFVAQAATILHWSRLSDYIGRKPVLLIGMTGLMISNLCFGLSETFWALVVSRSVAGLLNGNVGVMKCVIGEITDSTNMAQGFALLPPIFSIGAFIAPLYGGMLAKPHDRWPEVFSGAFWQRYPYFLSCAVAASFTALATVVGVLLLKESLPSRRSKKLPHSESSVTHDSVESEQSGSPVPIRAMLKMPSVMIPIVNYGTLALLEIAFFALLPLFYATPINIGGLGLPPSVIGVCMAVFGLGNGLFQVLFVGRVAKHFGEKKVFRSAVLAYFPLVAMFPIMSAVVQFSGEVGLVVWVLMMLQLIFMIMAESAYVVIFVFTTRATPNGHSLGTMNGLSQTTASIARAIGPAAFTSLFAFSKERNLVGGHLVYFVLWGLACCLVFLSSLLPDLKDGE